MAHRVAWTLSNGAIPDGLCACHRCDNPPCCNPAHLFLGTRADNNADKVAKGREAKGENFRARLKRGDLHGMRLHPERRPRGERHGMALLTEEKVRSIRAQHAIGGVTYAELAAQFGVKHRTIEAVISRQTWKAVDG